MDLPLYLTVLLSVDGVLFPNSKSALKIATIQHGESNADSLSVLTGLCKLTGFGGAHLATQWLMIQQQEETERCSCVFLLLAFLRMLFLGLLSSTFWWHKSTTVPHLWYTAMAAKHCGLKWLSGLPPKKHTTTTKKPNTNKPKATPKACNSPQQEEATGHYYVLNPHQSAASCDWWASFRVAACKGKCASSPDWTAVRLPLLAESRGESRAADRTCHNVFVVPLSSDRLRAC